MRLQAHGVNQVDPGEALLREVEQDGVFPDDFYSTTNLETRVRLGSTWVPVEQPGDGLRAGRRRTAGSAPSRVSDVKAGQRVVCGAGGVKVVLPLASTTRRGVRVHGVGGLQREAAVAAAAPDRPADARGQGRRRQGAVGRRPGVVHTGAAPAMVALVEAGYVDVLFAGNALATHDIEAALYGTSLGVDLAQGKGVEHGHEHHIRAINTIRKAGSIAAAVEQGVLTGGVMHAMVQQGKRFVLVGSVRDDGPLPDVYTDVIEGQRAMRAELPGRRLRDHGGDDAALDRDRQHPAGVGPAGVRRHQPGDGHQAGRPRLGAGGRHRHRHRPVPRGPGPRAGPRLARCAARRDQAGLSG
jgi:lysine-ketoglutarate reductase/saccharopine dehydrogenase-like protein (TIGR00300 family)